MRQHGRLRIVDGPGRPGSATLYGYRIPAVYSSPAVETAHTLPGLLGQVTSSFLGHGKITCDIWVRGVERGREAALIVRTGPRRLLVIGEQVLADDGRSALRAGEVPGWELHALPERQRPLHLLQNQLRVQDYRQLERTGFATVEELAATPDRALLDLRGVGTKIVAYVREAIKLLPAEAEVDRDRPGAKRAERIRAMLGPIQQQRHREFIGLLAEADLSGQALEVIAQALNAEPIPPADPEVIELLSGTAQRALAHYRATHQPATPGTDSIGT